jgi:hypothetical protein
MPAGNKKHDCFVGRVLSGGRSIQSPVRVN